MLKYLKKTLDKIIKYRYAMYNNCMNLDKIFNINILILYYRESKQNFFTLNHLKPKLGVTPDIIHKYKQNILNLIITRN